MTFAYRIKNEILKVKISLEQLLVFIIGILFSGSTETTNHYILKIKNYEIHTHILLILKKLKLIKKDYDNSIISIMKKNIGDLKIPSKYITQFAAGLFVGGGSISDSNSSSYHLEIRIFSKKYIDELINFFKIHNFSFTKFERKGKYIIYIKKSNMISDFLRFIGAHNGIMEFEEFRINRDFKNNLYRISNLEIHNQKKIVNSSLTQVELFQKIKESSHFSNLNSMQKIFIEIRIKNKYASLAEISDLLNRRHDIKITKSGLNHWIKKFKKFTF